MEIPISGRSAPDIADSVRDLVDRGLLVPGQALPPVRALAEQLGVNRNTVIAAYKVLVQAQVAITRGRGGTLIAKDQVLPEEGFSEHEDADVVDVGSGNPDPNFLPDLSDALNRLAADPVLYGESVIDPDLAAWAADWLNTELDREFRLTVTSGSADAVERLLAGVLTHGDGVGFEDPCFLTSIQTARLNGYRTVPIPVDEHGMTVAGLQAALASGVRAVVCTPRAHNPTGASLSQQRAAGLRQVLRQYPYVLVIEDDFFSMLTSHPYRSVVPNGHARWALVRSVSKFLGPDLRLAFTATDVQTAERLAARISAGTMWVSHLLQRLAHLLLTDHATQQKLAAARTHYARANARCVELLSQHGLAGFSDDGLNVWVDTGTEAEQVAARLLERGWRVRTGAEFALTDDHVDTTHLRLTVHQLDDDALARLVADLAKVVESPETVETNTRLV